MGTAPLAVSVAVRRLGPDDEALLKPLRLEALSADPDAFGSTYEREVARTDADWQRWFTHGATFLAEDEAGMSVGLAAGFRDFRGAPIAHVASMWVRATHRGAGVGDDLLKAVLEWAVSEKVEAARLNVVGGNVHASKLYERHGFYPTGNIVERERDGALEIEMQLDL